MTEVCGCCSRSLVLKDTFDLMFPPDGYDVIYYANGNIKFNKIDKKEVID